MQNQPAPHHSDTRNKAPDKAATVRVQRDGPGDRRRRRLFKSLHDCIISKGYVKTTLADIAEGAGMSASHLLYYFNGKEDVLEQYFQNVATRFLERIEGFRDPDTESQIHMLADFWFKGEASTRQEIGFMLECFGAAVHDDVLRVTKADFDMRCKAHLNRLFRNAEHSLFTDSTDAAELAYSMMIGLRSAVYFDDTITLERVHQLFLDALSRMCGISAIQEPA